MERKRRKCFVEQCDLQAISSHLLQRHGIINEIAHDGHVYEVGIEPFRNPMFKFRKIGINKAFTFPGFCNEHDTAIFKGIENGNIDVSDYMTKLLFSYRALVNEIRKKEILLEWHEAILSDRKVWPFLSPQGVQEIKAGIRGYKAAIQDGNYYLKKFNSDIYQSTQSFAFVTLHLPFVGVCASGVFTYENSDEAALVPESTPLTDVYFNLLPLSGNTVVIFGILKESKQECWSYIEDFRSSGKKEAWKKIGDLLLTQIENWLCSELVYQVLKRREAIIVEEIKRTTRITKERRQLSFNLFEGVVGIDGVTQ